MAERRVYKVLFNSQGKLYEIYARTVRQGELFGFVEVEGLLFGEKSQVVVDPSEEALKNEFRGVKTIHIPMHAVARIDLVEKEGVSRVTASGKDEGNVASFPSSLYTGPGRDTKKS